MKKNILFILLILICNSCNLNKKESGLEAENKLLKYDTIFAAINKTNNPNCNEKTNNYFLSFELFISNFYVINQKTSTEDDSIAILKPYYTQPNYSDCLPEKLNKNLLLVFNNKDKKTKIYDNLLFSEDRGIFQEIKSNKKGFTIYAEQGNSSKLFSYIYISKDKIDSIKLESWGFKQYAKTYKYDAFQIKNFQVKMIDSLQEISERDKR